MLLYNQLFYLHKYIPILYIISIILILHVIGAAIFQSGK